MYIIYLFVQRLWKMPQKLEGCIKPPSKTEVPYDSLKLERKYNSWYLASLVESWFFENLDLWPF
jgi:hypothetical protein